MQTQVGDVYLKMANRVGSALATINDFSTLEYAKTVNQVGVMTTLLPLSYRSKMRIGNQITIFRRPFGGKWYQEFGALWFVTKYELYIDQQGIRWLKVTCLCQNFILRDRDVAYYAASANASMTGIAGDLMKQVVRDSIGATANDYSTAANASLTTATYGTIPARGIPTTYLSIDSNTADGASISLDFSWRKVLDVLSDMATLSYQGGTYLAFDLVNDGVSHLTFRTFTGQRGHNRTWKNTGLMPPVIMDPLLGNLAGASLVYDAMDQATFVYAAGQGQETDRLVGIAYDADTINSGPFMRREKVVDARNVKTQAAVNQIAAMGLRDSKMQVLFSGQVSDAPGSIYGKDYFWGDRITCQFEKSQVECYLDYAHVTITSSDKAQGVEKKEIALRNVV